MNSPTVQENCSEVTSYKHMTKVTCQTTKWCSCFPFKHSAVVCSFVQLCKKTVFCVCVSVCVKRTCAFHWLPGVLFKLCIKAWITSQHTSQSSSAMTSQRHHWDLDITYHRSHRVWKSSQHRVCMVTYCSNAFQLAKTCLYPIVRMRCCITTAGLPESYSIHVSHFYVRRMLNMGEMKLMA